MTVHYLRPRQVAGFPVTIYETGLDGEIEIILWRDENRDDGFTFCARDWDHARRLLTALAEKVGGRP